MKKKQTHKPYSEELHKLLGKASSEILQARTAMAMIDGDNPKASKQLFIQAAETEQMAAQRLESEGHVEDVYISLVSAASCYQMAEQQAEALSLFQKALERPEMPKGVRLKVERLVKNSEGALEKENNNCTLMRPESKR